MARYGKSGSWYDLLVNVYAKNITGTLLNTDLSNNGLADFPVSLIRAGLFLYTEGTAHYRNTYGRYWVSTFYGLANAYNFRFYPGHFNPQYNTVKGYGFSVRCVAQDCLKHKLYVIIFLTARDINSLVERREDGSFY